MSKPTTGGVGVKGVDFTGDTVSAFLRRLLGSGVEGLSAAEEVRGLSGRVKTSTGRVTSS